MKKVSLRLSRLVLCAVLMTGCLATEEDGVSVTIVADGNTQQIVVNEESTVTEALRRAGITADELDRINPPGFSRVSEGLTITLVRVSEETVVIEEMVPFERRTTLNDGLQAGATRLLQAGVNGLAEITYRITYEDGNEVARSEIRRVLISAPQDEVVMVGSQIELPTVTVNGTLAYISSGNAWVIQQNSKNKRPMTVNGGVDGRVLALSDNGRALLFSRNVLEAPEESGEDATPAPDTEEEPFNTLWVLLDTGDPDARAIRLDLDNILYAEWVPGSNRYIIYSTAESRLSFPGWQANNDLWRAEVRPNGAVINRKQLLEPSSGGVYGWYGTLFAFSPDGVNIAWAQPDGAGVLIPIYEDEQDEESDPPTPVEEAAEDDLFLTPTGSGLLEDDPVDEEAIFEGLPDAYEKANRVAFAPRNAYDFVWVPTLAWSPDGQTVITTTHGAPIGAETVEDSPVFNVTAFFPERGYSADLVELSGMWASPAYSASPSVASGETDQGIRLAFLQAINPLDSVVSRYRLVVMDRDGSNQRFIFPPEDKPGIGTGDLSLYPFAWSPVDSRQIAVVYEGNIFLLDTITGLSQQLTSDGLSNTVRWAGR